MEPRAGGRLRASRSRQLRRLPLPTGDWPRCVHPTQHQQDRCRPKAHPAAGWWPRCWSTSPTAAASSVHRFAYPSVIELGLGRSIGCMGRAWITRSPSRSSPPQGELVDRQHHRTRAGPRALIFRCRGGRVTDHLPCLGIAGGGRRVTDPSAVRPPTLETASASKKPKSGPPCWAGRHAHGFKSCSGELIPSCLCWTKWCTDAVEVTQCLGVGAEHGGLAVGEVVLLAERPD